MLSVRLLSFAYSVTAGRWTSWQDGLDHMKDGGILEALPLVAVVQSWIFAGALLCVTIPPAGRLSRLTLFALCVAAAAAASCVHVFSTAAFQWLGICKDGNAGQAQWANWARTWLCFAYGTVLPLAATVSLVGKVLLSSLLLTSIAVLVLCEIIFYTSPLLLLTAIWASIYVGLLRGGRRNLQLKQARFSFPFFRR
ncbi:hypothetical protein JCM10213v2_001909 [Rhodosporidiobolus nylandii]